MGQHQEPTIAIVDAIVVAPNPGDVNDVEQGNTSNQYINQEDVNGENSNNYHKQQRYQAEPTSPECNSSEIVTPSTLLRQQPPRPAVIYGHLGRYECAMQCPFCDKTVMTRTDTRCDCITWIFVLILLILFWPLFWLPFCMPRCQRVHHYCSNCNRKVGVTEPCN